MVNPSSNPCVPCPHEGIVKLKIVDQDIAVTPCRQCQIIPSTPQGETPVVQNSFVEPKDWCYETPLKADNMWARSTSKMTVRFQTPQFTPMKRFDFKVKPTPVPKQIPPIEPDTPTPSPSSEQKSPMFPPSATSSEQKSETENRRSEL